MLVILLLVLLGWGISSAVAWPGFRPRAVGVSGAHIVPVQAVRAAAAIGADGNIWLLNPWAIRRRIETIPYVQSVTLHRALPNIVGLSITERRAESCIRGARGMVVTIDAMQRALEFGCKAPLLFEIGSLPKPQLGATIDDPHLTRMRSIVAGLGSQGIKLRHVWFDRDDGAVIESSEGLTIMLGDETDLATKVHLIQPIITAAKLHHQVIEEVDLRSIDTPVVRYRETRPATQNRAAKE